MTVSRREAANSNRAISHKIAAVICEHIPITFIVAVRRIVGLIIWDDYVEILIVEYDMIAIALISNHKVTSPSVETTNETLFEGCCATRA